MYTITTPVPETEESFTRPLVRQLIQGFLHHVSFRPDIEVLYNGAVEVPVQEGSTIDSVKRQPRTGAGERLDVTVEESIHEPRLHQMTPQRRSTDPVFVDPESGVMVYPVYIATRLEVSMKYQSSGESKADKLNSYLASVAAGVDQTFSRSIFFQLPLGNMVVEFLSSVVENRNELFDAVSTKDYIEAYLAPNHTVLTNQAGNLPLYAFNTTYNRIVCTIDTYTPPKPNREDGGAYATEIKFIAYYDKPATYRIEYPLVVYNKEIDEKYLSIVADKNTVELLPAGASSSIVSTFTIERMNEDILANNPHNCALFPKYDSWRPTGSLISKYTPVLQMQLTVDLQDRQTVLSLDDLPSVGIHLQQPLLDWYFDTPDGLFDPDHSPLFFAMYSQDGEITPDFTYDKINRRLITTGYKLNPLHDYHLVMYFNRDLAHYSSSMLNRITKHPMLLHGLVEMVGQPLPKKEIITTDDKGNVKTVNASPRVDYCGNYYIRTEDGMIYSVEYPDLTELRLTPAVGGFTLFTKDGYRFGKNNKGDTIFIGPRKVIYKYITGKFVPTTEEVPSTLASTVKTTMAPIPPKPVPTTAEVSPTVTPAVKVKPTTGSIRPAFAGIDARQWLMGLGLTDSPLGESRLVARVNTVIVRQD